MNYTALYRQFRPQKFSELVGQEHISKTLINSIEANRIAHAYLFSGPRGTGKTSTAKIFAKAVNCLKNTNGEPCNECDNCLKITAGNALDVIEIDAASNRGIDEIRDLREKVKYAPAEGRYKVYIIDEVHMLTAEAFNALLKTLEEPPKHIIFILATTEPHKLPATIVSRCQRFDFKRISFDFLLNQLKKVASEVGIDAEEKALFVIAKKAEGGLRDALSLLDQSAAYGNGKVTYDLVVEVLGAALETEILDLLDYLLKGAPAEIMHTVRRFVDEGKDLKIILLDLQEMMRNAILVKIVLQRPETLDEDTYQRIKDMTLNVELHKLYKILEILAETENTMKYAAQARITFEVGLLRTLVVENEQPQSSVKANLEIKHIKSENVASNKVEQKNISRPRTKVADGAGVWKKLLDDTKKTNKVLHAFLVEGNLVAFSEQNFKIEFESDREFHYQQIMHPENLQILTKIIRHNWGEGIKLDVTLIPKEENGVVDLSKKIQDMFGKDKVEIID